MKFIMILRETCHKFKETHAQDIKKSTPEKPPSPQTRAAENEIIKVQDIINRLKTGEARASKKLRGSNANRVIQFAQPVSPHFFPRPLKKKYPAPPTSPATPNGGEGRVRCRASTFFPEGRNTYTLLLPEGDASGVFMRRRTAGRGG